MTRADAVARLEKIAPELRASGVAHLYLFGSVARGDSGPTSDLDIFIDPVSADFLRLDSFMAPFALIEGAFPEMPVGYSTRAGLSEHVRNSVEDEAVRVF